MWSSISDPCPFAPRLTLHYLEHVLKKGSVNSLLTAKFDKRKNKHDLFPRKVSNAQEKVRGMLEAEFMKWLFRFGIIELRLQLRYERMNNNSKREITFFSRWRVTCYPNATFITLELGKYADCTKPVFCPFRNHWINFLILVRVFRAQFIHQKYNFMQTFKQDSPW